MAIWSATLVSIQADVSNGNIIATVDFTDDSDPQRLQRMQTWGSDLTDDSIAAWASTVVVVLMARDSTFAAITLKSGPIQLLPPPTPDPVAVAQQALNAATQRLAQYQLLVNSGAMQQSDSLYVGAVSDAKAALGGLSAVAAEKSL